MRQLCRCAAPAILGAVWLGFMVGQTVILAGRYVVTGKGWEG